MEHIGLIDQLKKADLFSQLTSDDLTALATIARTRKADVGEFLFAAGDRASGFYVLLQGKIKLYKVSPDGKEYILRVVRDGQTFAEAAAFSGPTYPVFAETMSPCNLVYFDVADFRSLIQRSPQLALNMIATMASLLQSLNQQIEDLSLREVMARLCRYLLAYAGEQHGGAIADGNSFRLETTKSALAARLGTISETLSRTFKKLQQGKLLAVERDRVTLLDCRRLRQVADGDLKL
ncbi:MAG: Crp/Fnr family transcriptional regulator [Deltaproteobacteria bacterium]|nr:MAG: Crp/Fnr family transcriptional regulator [Deltaproteobacteria bacterium]